MGKFLVIIIGTVEGYGSSKYNCICILTCFIWWCYQERLNRHIACGVFYLPMKQAPDMQITLIIQISMLNVLHGINGECA